MENRKRGSYTVTLPADPGEVARTLTFRFGLNELCAFEQETGRGVPEVLCELLGIQGFEVVEAEEIKPDFRKIRLTDFRSLVRASLSRHQPSITVEDAGDLLEEYTAEVIEGITESFQRCQMVKITGSVSADEGDGDKPEGDDGPPDEEAA